MRLVAALVCTLHAGSGLASVGSLAAQAPTAAAASTQDVAPILARCVECHGERRQRRGLRLDTRAGAVRGGRSGPALVPGDPDGSLLLQRVAGIGKRMPPTGPALTAAEIATLRAWVAAGAPAWGPETGDDPRPWSWRPIADPTPPAGEAHPIDAFVVTRLRSEGLALAPREERGKLLRRVSLDLIGLPPSVADLEAFATDDRPDAWAQAVDRLLASPHFGERWAQMWLDVARYADTKGYEKDARRSIWRWRDWVIDAFDADMPFDVFTTAQLAGDLLPHPTQDDLVATAFHRNTMTNDEGGTDDEEFRVAAVVDRVNTTMAVWMGTTMGCCQCHDHKYDRLSQREYYQLLAFFDDTEDDDDESDRPTVQAPTPEQRDARAVRTQVRASLAAALAAESPEREAAFGRWLASMQARLSEFDAARLTLSPWRQSGPYRGRDFADAFARAFAPESDPAAVKWTSAAYADGQVHLFTPGDNSARYLERRVRARVPVEVTFALGSDDALKVWLDGRQLLASEVHRPAALDQERVTVLLPAGESRLLVKVVNGGGDSGFAFELRPLPLAAADIETIRRARPGPDAVALHALYRDNAPELTPLRAALAAVDAQLAAIDVPTVPVLRELPPGRARVTRIHRRGDFRAPGDVVAREVPAGLHAWPEGAPRDRLGLARWLVAPDNPLTARVLVNRLWEQLFGKGLVETSEDFGVQGEPPSHPLLLDWLARDLVAHGWSVKHALRTIVTSATYCQSTCVEPELLLRDPDNRLLARGPRGRLSAEAIRDQALAVSGLLCAIVHGPSVMPPQPDGVWNIIYSNDRWRTSPGCDRHRRGLYTFWRRTSPYPSMLTFDAPSREVCVVRRVPTNTPLQALVTLDDPVFTEAASALAARMVREGGASIDDRIAWGFLACTGRRPTAPEVQRLVRLWAEQTRHDGRAGAEQRAYDVVANVLLNLDETLTKG